MNFNLQISRVYCKKNKIMEKRAKNKFFKPTPPEQIHESCSRQSRKVRTMKSLPRSKSCSDMQIMQRDLIEEHRKSKKSVRVEKEHHYLKAKVCYLYKRLEESRRENVDMVHELKLLQTQVNGKNELIEELKKHQAHSLTEDLADFRIQQGLVEAHLQALSAKTEAEHHYQAKAQALDCDLLELKRKHAAKLLELSNEQNAELIDEVSQLKLQACNMQTQIQELLHQLALANKNAEQLYPEANLALEKYASVKTALMKNHGYIAELEMYVKRLEADLKDKLDASLCGDDLSIVLECCEEEKHKLLIHNEMLANRLQQERTMNDRLQELVAVQKARISHFERNEAPGVPSKASDRAEGLQLVLEMALDNNRDLEARNAALTAEKEMDAKTFQSIVEGTKQRISAALKGHKA